jgi:tetratricopeptide (TPR) repeat protein
LAEAKLHLGQYKTARELAQLTLAHSRESSNPVLARTALFALGLLALAGEAYDEAQRLLQDSVEIGRKTERQAELGQTLAGLGFAALGLGEYARAREHLCEALALGAEIGHVWTLVEALPAVALSLADQGDAERAVELYTLASRYPYVANSRSFEDIAGKHITALAATLPTETVAAARDRGRARDLWETAQELLEELGE